MRWTLLSTRSAQTVDTARRVRRICSGTAIRRSGQAVRQSPLSHRWCAERRHLPLARTHLLAGQTHGFARRRRFDVVAAEPSTVRFRLTPDEQSRAACPFEFELDVSFVVSGATLTVTARAVNNNAGVMPASLGFHPAFRWPLPDASSRTPT